MTEPQIPMPEADDNPGDEIPSFSASARESASKRRQRTASRSSDTLTSQHFDRAWPCGGRDLAASIRQIYQRFAFAD
jgi:hypothetical protein